MHEKHTDTKGNYTCLLPDDIVRKILTNAGLVFNEDQDDLKGQVYRAIERIELAVIAYGAMANDGMVSGASRTVMIERLNEAFVRNHAELKAMFASFGLKLFEIDGTGDLAK